MAGEIQLNSTTMATESSGTITLSNVNSATNRTNLGLGSIATQNANAVALTGGSLTGTEIDLKSSGTTIYKSDGTTAVLSESGGVVTLNNGTIGSSVVFPANTVIGFKFVEIGNQALSGTYTKFNTTTAATSAQGLEVVSTTYDPKSDNSLIYVMANLTVSEESNLNDETYAALFVGTSNLSQAATQDKTTGSAREYTVANLSGTYTNSSLSQLTIQVRASGDTDLGLHINGQHGDVPFTDSVSYYYKTGLTIMEIQQ